MKSIGALGDEHINKKYTRCRANNWSSNVATSEAKNRAAGDSRKDVQLQVSMSELSRHKASARTPCMGARMP